MDHDEIAKALDVVEEGGKFPKLFSATTRKKKKEEILAAFAALLVEANRGTLDDAMIIQRLREERDDRDAIIESQICQGCDKNRLALADALTEFVVHKPPCPFVTLLEDYKGEDYKCTCGLDEALAAFQAGEKGEVLGEPEKRFECPDCGSHHFGTSNAHDPERATVSCHGDFCHYTAAYNSPKHWAK